MGTRRARAATAAALSIVALPVAAPDARAQGSWVRASGEPRGVTVEYLRPFTEGGDPGLLGGALMLSGERSITSETALEIELPFAFETGGRTSGLTLGNPYLGLVSRDPGRSGALRLGLRIPIARRVGGDGDAALFGLYSDFDRSERFLSDHLSLHGSATGRSAPRGENALVVRGGATLTTPIGGGPDDTSLYLHYGTRFEAPGQEIRFGLGVTGRMNVTAENADLTERTVHQLELTGAAREGTVRPAVLLRVPVDSSLGNVVNFVFGFGIEIREG